MKIFLNRYFINGLFLLALILMTVGNVFNYQQTQSAINSIKWTIHTRQVIDTANKAFFPLIDARLLMHQYLATNNKLYLELIPQKFQQSKQSINLLRQLTIDNPTQQRNINELEPLINDTIGQFQSIEKNNSENNKNIASKILTGESQTNLNKKISGLFQVINNEEQRLLDERDIASSSDIEKNNSTFISRAIINEGLFILSILLLNYYIFDHNRIERKKAESEQRLKLIIDNTPDYAILMLDPKGIVTTWSSGAEKIMGYKADEIIGKHFSAFYTENARTKNSPANELQAAKEQGRYEQEDWRVHKDGSKFWANVITTPIYDNKANLLGFSKITRDLTEQRKVELLKNEFISVVSHELRTPLTSIRGSISLLLSGAVESAEKTKHLLEIANTNCDRLVLLINDILDFEKIKAGKMQFDIHPYDVSKLVTEAIAINQPYGEKYGVKIACPQIISGMTVNVDTDRMMQVLTNLISNAVKFSPQGGQVIIKMSKVNNNARIAVINHGIGISDEFKDKIFERFSQADVSNTREKSGTGLGLAISKAIIEKFEGTIQFTSEPNKETIFYVDLPLLEEQQKAPVLSTTTDAHRVLICEDDEDQAAYLSTLLRSAGYQTDISYTGSQAKRLLNERKYYALLLDLILPDMNGVELIKQLRHENNSHYIPIIVISVIANESKMLLNGDAIEVVDWLDKPVDFNKLSKAFSIIKEHKRVEKPKVLHIEDDVDIQEMISNLLQDRSDTTAVATIKKAEKILADKNFDLVILDLLLPDGDGAQLLPLIAKKGIPVIVFARNELENKYAKYVKKALIKSENSPERLLESINDLLHVS